MKNVCYIFLIILNFTHCQENKTIIQESNAAEKQEQKLLDNYTFLQEQNYFTLNSEPEDVNAWILERVKKAKKGTPELVQIPLSYINVGYEDYKLHIVPMPGEIPDPLWIEPDLDDSADTINTSKLQHYVIGYFTGNDAYKSQDTEAEERYHSYDFKVLTVEEKYNISNLIQPKIIAGKIFSNIKTLHNIEMISFSFLYDENKYTPKTSDLPKGQRVLQHNDSKIEVLFQGLTLDSDTTPEAYVGYFVNSIQSFENTIHKFNLKENWFFFSGYSPEDKEYIIIKKWFIDNASETLNIRMNVNEQELSQAYQILEEFNKQVIPAIH